MQKITEFYVFWIDYWLATYESKKQSVLYGKHCLIGQRPSNKPLLASYRYLSYVRLQAAKDRHFLAIFSCIQI